MTAKMEAAIPTAGLYALGAVALAVPTVMLKSRLQLSKAKHPSLSGHARLARRVASWVPFYHYDDSRFFVVDGAPDAVAAQRRADFVRLAGLYSPRYARKFKLTAE